MNRNNQHNIAIYQWHQLIEQSCNYIGIKLEEDVQSYLLLTLVRYIHDDELVNEAIEFSSQLRDDLPLDPRAKVLKHQAEHSLILAGLFPSHIDRQQQRISHFIQHGAVCFSQLASRAYDADKLIYQKLSENLVNLVDVLYTLRQFNGSPALPMLQAIELWSDTGSSMAYRTLTMNRDSFPLREQLVTQQIH